MYACAKRTVLQNNYSLGAIFFKKSLLDFYEVTVHSGFGFRPHQLSPHRNLELVIQLLNIVCVIVLRLKSYLKFP